ncbi:glycerol-3-phosphate responsive antiterminator [Caldanaerobacter subterraneus]|jgi:glycerol uptake operon antiterminator|uniref:Glycerol uptake operon antiterminator n=2 Tax=Caldanaerobacter subterraneus TaxID=911092 RepID=U5CVE9_CALSX|nr:glycerol-3-phosphate responsive antiterminator [Caldanaerobacter subterraneus]ERM92052.1 glycerol uptake operon antiterminator [Caldanaerobacter subterraneus subsp. yonseiensis KB-1]MBE3579050.1 glycerol-3-phosphate responsive antiterminator [Caldanaerobacter subterraneus]NNG66350.1 glycerol-3-phosphate responsive antiterminator [Caldanaerobacter subterraneus]
MKDKILETMTEFPIIAAVREIKDVKEAVSSNTQVIFLLAGDIMNICDLVDFIKKNGKIAFIHFDLIEGLGKDTKAVEYIAERIKPHGIISTRNNILDHAKDFGLFSIQRLFMLDSQALKTGLSSAKQIRPDAVEILPGIMPSIIKEVANDVLMPVIAGGLVRTKEEVINAIKAGAIAVSTSEKSLWFIE